MKSTSSQRKHLLKAFAVELVIYSVLVTGYFFLVLHFASAWLKELFDQHRNVYALVAFVVIVGQGILLETVTSWLLRILGKKIH